MKHIKSIKFTLALIVSAILLLQFCTNEPILSQLVNSRIKMIVKGTYESNSPYAHRATLYEDDYDSGDLQPFNRAINFSEMKMYLDIAEIRIATGNGFTTGTQAEDYWDFFARDRILLCSEYTALQSKELDTCKENEGVTKLTSFFEEGFSYPVLDLAATTYQHLAIYIRKFITSPSSFYDDAMVLTTTSPKAKFDQRQLNALDIAKFYQYNPTETSDLNPKLFPLEKTGLSLVVPPGDESYVLEVRIFMKNLFMTHNQSDKNITGDGIAQSISYIGISDWLYNYSYKDTSSSPTNGRLVSDQMGGNILMTARIYEPKKVATITITSDGGTSAPSSPYYALVETGTTFTPTANLPLAATQATLPASIINLPTNKSYDVYKTCDSSFYTLSGIDTTNNKDGFPETSVLCATNISVTSPGETVSITLPQGTATCSCP